MDFELSEDQRAFQALAADFAANEMAPHAARWDEDCCFPRETLKQAAALGFGAICMGDDVGGAGLGRIDAALVFEALSAGCASPAAFLSNHNMAGRGPATGRSASFGRSFPDPGPNCWGATSRERGSPACGH